MLSQKLFSVIIVSLNLLCTYRCIFALKFQGQINFLTKYRSIRTNSPLIDQPERFIIINGRKCLPLLYDSKSSLENKEDSAFEKVASMGLAGVLAIAVAEAIFWAAGMPLAAIWYKFTTGEWIDLASTDGQLKAAGFSFGYGGFATLILQYRVTIFAIPLVPIMDKLVVQPGKKFFGEQFGEKTDSNINS